MDAVTAAAEFTARGRSDCIWVPASKIYIYIHLSLLLLDVYKIMRKYYIYLYTHTYTYIHNITLHYIAFMHTYIHACMTNITYLTVHT